VAARHSRGREGIFGKGAKTLNAAEFNVLYKGTGVNSRMKGAVEACNYGVKQIKTLNSAWSIFSYLLTGAQLGYKSN